MRQDERGLLLSATDLANFLGCRHLTHLDARAARHELEAPGAPDAALRLLAARGARHEEAYLASLAAQGLTALRLPDGAGAADTLAAMRDGAPLIAQAVLEDGPWTGRADLLRRTSTPSALGPHSYEVVDTKLARETRAGTVLQLCLYSDLLARVQGHLPEAMHVVAPGDPFTQTTYRTADYFAYYRWVARRLEAEVDRPTSTYPEPVAQCDFCRWWGACRQRWREDDHLSLVAGLSRLQRQELEALSVTTLEQLAGLQLPLRAKPRRGALDGYTRAREQARLQLESRRRGLPVYELLECAPGQGLARLPEATPADIFFDFEGDPFYGTGGIDYLFGWVEMDGGRHRYRRLWATDLAGERAAFEQFIDHVMRRWEEEPGMHVYHFGHYEAAHLKGLMGRHATRERELDRLLRAEVLVDLHAIFKQAVRAGVERYSLKDLEPLHGFTRRLDLRRASAALREVEWALELDLGAGLDPAVRAEVETYNEDDCLSTARLRQWLEARRRERVLAGDPMTRPQPASGDASESVAERDAATAAVAARLLAGVPQERDARSAEEQARWLLSHLLEFHRRELNADYWELYRLRDLPEADLAEERAGLWDLQYVEAVPGGTRQCPIHRYRYAPQEATVRPGPQAYAKVAGTPGVKIGTILAIDSKERTIDIKKRKAAADVHPRAIFAHRIFQPAAQQHSLLRLGAWVADHGLDGPGPFRAARDLLLRRAPRVAGGWEGVVQLARSDPTAAARRAGLGLEEGVLAIQGPPGAGKTYTGARMITDLVAAGRKVGIAAVSHKVIDNLLRGVLEAAGAQQVDVRCGHRGGDERPDVPVQTFSSNEAAAAALTGGTCDVMGGTSFFWAREEVMGSIDVLFVDEAGQMSLADVLAIAPAARSIVLLGDPQQLDQPQQARHPEGVEVSALEHLLAGQRTMPENLGLFLEHTWRLPPAICAFTSEVFYEGRLHSRDHTEQALVGPTRLAGAGLWLCPVPHQGNQTSSPEEVEAVAALCAELTRPEVAWRGPGGEKPVGLDDILIVAPYNAQVAALAERLPRARVGTVDRFQGQEAAVVIVSLATSTPDDAPRGMEFLYSPDRLNVATSRARCACILVTSPALLEPSCRTPRQMQLANAFCRYVEMARPLSLDG